MFETVLLATDGSVSVKRCVNVTLDVADRFDATVHALYVIDTTDIESSPDSVREGFREGLNERARSALNVVAESTEQSVTTAVREGRPAAEIIAYAREIDADVVATGTRGRHGENRLLLGSVAEDVVRTSPVPVLTVRQLSEAEAAE